MVRRKSFLARLAGDLRSGQNIDLILLLVGAVGVSAASLLNLADSGVVDATTLALLAVLAVALLTNRYQTQRMEELFTQVAAPDVGRLPSDFGEMIGQAGDLFFCGSGLTGLTIEYGPEISTTLKAGGSIRVLMVDPQREDLHEFINNRLSQPFDSVQRMCEHGRQTVYNWQRFSSEAGARVEIRYSATVPQFRMYLVNPGDGRQTGYVRFYRFRSPDEDLNKMWTRLDDLGDAWSQSLVAETERMWQSATPADGFIAPTNENS